MLKFLLLGILSLYTGPAMSDDFNRIMTSAQSGNGLSQYAVGNYYESKNDFLQALHWYTMAANQGLAQAQFQLGLIYEEGRKGVEKSTPEAISWYEEAARNGFQKAIEKLKSIR